MNHMYNQPATRKQHGFTLIELLVVITIIGFLAAVALPSYQQYIIRGHRAAAQAQMLDIANRQQQYILSNRRYTTTLSEIGYTLPTEIAARYSLGIAVPEGAPPSFTITFTPTTIQRIDGPLVLTNAGVKLRNGVASQW